MNLLDFLWSRVPEPRLDELIKFQLSRSHGQGQGHIKVIHLSNCLSRRRNDLYIALYISDVIHWTMEAFRLQVVSIVRHGFFKRLILFYARYARYALLLHRVSLCSIPRRTFQRRRRRWGAETFGAVLSGAETCSAGSWPNHCADGDNHKNAPRLNPSDTRFTYPGGIEGWVDLDRWLIPRWLSRPVRRQSPIQVLVTTW